MKEVTKVNGDAPIYNLKAVVMETGLKPPTIRAWERRYGLPQPHRTSGGHRQYSQRDIEILKWLVARQQEGVSISHAVELWESIVEQGEDPLLPTKRVPAVQVAPPAPPLGTGLAELREEWVAACLAYDRGRAEQVLSQAFALFTPEIVCIEVLQKGLAGVGQRWYDGEITVQQEHFTSALSIQRLETLITAAPPPSRPERIIISSAQNDFHVFSPLLLTYLMRRRGWDVIYLGADVPVAELADMVAKTDPDMLIISAQLLSTAASLVDVTSALQDFDMLIAYGGLIFNLKPELQERIAAHYLGPTLEGAVDAAERLLARRPAALAVEQPELKYAQAQTQFDQRRPLIESHVWSTYAAAGKSTEHLIEINRELAGIIMAALKFGDLDLLDRTMEWKQYLMVNYHLSEAQAAEYLAAYFQAAKIHLGGPAQIVTSWLADLATA